MFSAAVGRVRAAVAPADAPDAVLLARFVRTRCPDAFAALVKRHGPAVLAACRRVTGCPHLADDAFQAVFLVLARRAADVRPAAAVGAFLHGVAVRTAQDARSMAARRRARETPTAELPDPPAPSSPDTEALALLDAEVARLPDHLRAAVVLCELEGRPRAEVAAAFGIPDGTLSSRLAKARKLLADRLRRRGVGLPAAVATALVPAELAAQTAGLAAGSGAVPARVAELAEGVVKAMFLKKLKAAAVLTVFGLAAGGLLLTAAAPARSDEPAKPKAQAARPMPAGPGTLAFYRQGHVAVIDPDGKNPKDLLSDGDHPRLSPDGRRVAYTVTQIERDGRNSQPRRLHVRDLDAAGDGTDLGLFAMLHAWSPDGTELLAVDFDDGPADKVKFDPETRIVNVRTKEATAVPMPAGHLPLEWTPDGKRFLTLVTDEKRTKFELWLVNRDGTPDRRLTKEGEFWTIARLSPAGDRLLSFRADPRGKPDLKDTPALVVLELATGKVTPVADVPETAEVMGFCWSPDGRRIAYCWRQRVGGTAEQQQTAEVESHLIVCDPDGRNTKTIASEKGEGQWRITLSGVDWR